MTVNNTGVTALAGTGISVSAATGSVTVTPTYAAPTALAIDSTVVTGAAASVANSAHVHAMPGSATAGASAVGDTAATGTATTVALSDHRHSREAFGTPIVVNGQTTALATGSLTTLARADHVHTLSNVPTLLASTTLSSAAATISLTSIPQTFTNLLIIANLNSAYSSASVGVYIRANSDAGSNYYNGATAYTGYPLFSITAATNFIPQPSLLRIHINNYSSTSSKKYAYHSLVYNNSTSSINLSYNLNHSMWNNSAAITRLDAVQDVGGNFLTGSRIDVYGL
jgi:hypothetical protein